MNGVVGFVLVILCVALGAFVATWVGVVAFVAVVVARISWSWIDARRILRDQRAANPSQPHADVRHEYEEAVRTYGARSREARLAKRAYRQALASYVRKTRAARSDPST